MPKRILFYCNIEIDLLMISSISIMIKEMYTDSYLTLISTTHKRLQDKSNQDYFKLFDEVKFLNYYDVPSNMFSFYKGFKMTIYARKSIKALNIENNEMFIAFDLFKYMDVLLFNYVKSQKISTVIVSAFIGKRFNLKGLTVRWHQTLIYNIYSILNLNFKLYIDYRVRETNYGGYRIFYDESDYNIALENSTALMRSKNYFTKMPFPVLHALKQITNVKSKNKNKLLLLVSSLHGIRSSTYWSNVKSIIDKIPTKYTVFVKDHPQGKSELTTELLGFNFIELNQKHNMERLVYENNFDLVLGYASTGLITSSWMGLSVYDYSKLLDFSNNILKYYNDYMEMGYNIKILNTLDDIKKMELKRKNINYNEKIISKPWKHTLKKILSK